MKNSESLSVVLKESPLKSPQVSKVVESSLPSAGGGSLDYVLVLKASPAGDLHCCSPDVVVSGQPYYTLSWLPAAKFRDASYNSQGLAKVGGVRLKVTLLVIAKCYLTTAYLHATRQGG
jgi:hypothetical protein